MAEKETDDTLEEISPDEDSSSEPEKGLSQALLIKIAIGLLVLLIIAGAAYFFLMPADEPASEVAASIEESILSESDVTEDDATTKTLDSPEYTAEDIQLLKMREEAVALKEENLQMKERLSKLESQQNSAVETSNTNVEIPEPAIDKAPAEDHKKTTDATPKPTVKENPYANLYSRDYTREREPQRAPPPEPKWGNFDPLYRGK